MNIQQALNQSLLSAATATYFASDILDKGKQSGIDKYQKASDELTESNKQQLITSELVRDEYNEAMKDKKFMKAQLGKDDATEDEVKKFIDDQVKIDSRVINANARVDLANKNFQHAERNLKRWDKDRDEVKSYQTKHETNYDNMQTNFLQDLQKARLDAKALKSLAQGIETATNTEKAVKERPDIINKISHSNINPNPSIRMEVE